MGQILAKSLCETGFIFSSEFCSLADNEISFLAGHWQIPYFHQFQNVEFTAVSVSSLLGLWWVYPDILGLQERARSIQS